MSDSTEIFEITDSSINIIETEASSVIEASETNKRKRSEDESSEPELVEKKICTNDEISQAIDDSKNDDSDDGKTEVTIRENQEECERLIVLNEEDTESNNRRSDNQDIEDKLSDTSCSEDNDDQNVIDDESSYDEDNDEELMLNAMNNCESAKKIEVVNETIALGDTSDEDMLEEEEEVESDKESSLYEAEFDNSSSFDYSSRRRVLQCTPKFFVARKIVKRSIKFLHTREIINNKNKQDKSENVNQSNLKNEEDQIDNNLNDTIPEKIESKSTEPKDSVEHSENCLPTKEEEAATEPLMKQKPVENNNQMEVESGDMNDNDNPEPTPVENSNLDVANQDAPQENNVEKEVKVMDTSNINDDESSNENKLLTEISNCSIDDMLERYVLRINDRSALHSVDEFVKELFICLDQNKHDIYKAQQLWNEKVHVKYKIRELLEKIRRHKAVSEIENFGKLQDNAACNIMFSSKSSTTTNSENEHCEKASRMSESVNRLIQDVRTNVLKKDGKQRIDELSSQFSLNDSFGDSSTSAQNLSQSNQGRQGQTIDVQSIINDFRSKNPQEIPRRGRRMKNSFDNGSYIDNQISSHHSNKINLNAKFNQSSEFNNATKSDGFPEVSLLPVNNFYRNISNNDGLSPSYGQNQKSSLLQSILTKQSSKSSIGLPHFNNATAQTSSTLARLLTAPERSFRHSNNNMTASIKQPSKIHSNGEITITPIAGTSRKDFTMDDEENSIEPPLVIDETEDFDSLERSKMELLCQGCRRNKALFMCAGCSRQWYCSKECQEFAWEDHADSCNEPV